MDMINQKFDDCYNLFIYIKIVIIKFKFFIQ